jgi:hypothetical protein
MFSPNCLIKIRGVNPKPVINFQQLTPELVIQLTGDPGYPVFTQLKTGYPDRVAQILN